jgi:hypothetical protein
MNRRIFITKVLRYFSAVALFPVVKFFQTDRLSGYGGQTSPVLIKTPVPRKRNHISELKKNDGYLLRINRGNQTEIHLNEMGRLIWSEIDGRKSCYQIAESIMNRYQVNFAEAATDVEGFVINLSKEGFVNIERCCPCYAYQIAGPMAA